MEVKRDVVFVGRVNLAKLKTDDILDSDLIEYLNSTSDFGFEQQVFKSLVELKFHAQHGGTYTDPGTGTPREFDIRGSTWFYDPGNEQVTMDLQVAVECKNIPTCFPLLVECVPRSHDEGFHDIVRALSTDPSIAGWQCHRITSGSMYREVDMVGKSCCQVGRGMNDDISNTDSGVYSKWSQARMALS